MGFWVNPHGQSVGGGGGELPEVITWDMIEGKPGRFAPTAHTHEMEEIINLEETISELFVMIDNRVKKVDGKGLSEEDFTTALKNKLVELDPNDKGVISVNGITGEHVIITKESLELGNVLNIEQASKEELELLKLRIEALEDIELDHPVKSINGKIGEVQLNKSDIGLSNVLDIEQAPKVEFDIHVSNQSIHVTSEEKENLDKIPILEQELQEKVDKIDGKGLSSNDFTTEYKNKVEKIDMINEELSTKPSIIQGTSELEKELLSNKESDLKQPNLKNIVIVNSLEELNSIEPYQGLIAIISSGD